MARFEAVLRFGIDKGHEYVFASTRRENGAIAECDKMVAETVSNMTEHCHGGKVVVGSHPTDPNATVVAAVHPNGGPVVYKVVTYRPVVVGASDDDGLGDALLASLYAVGAVSV